MSTQSSPNAAPGRRRTEAHVLADYSGRGAATVADDLRRLGLRPGVQRVDAATPGEVGAILAQDPPAGASAARNSVVTLYVGATHHDPAAVEPPLDREPSDAAALVTPGARRRRKARHPQPVKADGGPRADATAEPQHGAPAATERGTTTGRYDPARPHGLDEDTIDVESAAGGELYGDPFGDVAPDRRRVHQDGSPRGTLAEGAPREPPSDMPLLEPRALLTPLDGLPRRFARQGWRRISRRARDARRARVAIVSTAVCVLALTAIAVGGHRQPPQQLPVTVPGAVSHRSPRTPGPGRRPELRSRASRRARAARPSVMVRTRPPAASPITPPSAPAAAPAAAPAQPPVPSAPASTAPAGVGRQIPGGPFSP